MTKHIENSDRGITLNKSLAWAMVVGLTTASIGLGGTMSNISTSMKQFTKISSDAIAARTSLEIRIRALETSMAQGRTQFESIYGTLQDLKIDQREITNLLRQIVNERQTP